MNVGFEVGMTMRTPAITSQVYNLCGLQSFIRSIHYLACRLVDWPIFF